MVMGNLFADNNTGNTIDSFCFRLFVFVFYLVAKGAEFGCLGVIHLKKKTLLYFVFH
jgi:hypothetical protein